MTTLTFAQRRKLKKEAHHLHPLVQVGKAGVNEAVIKSIDEAMSTRELIKIKFVDGKEAKRELSREIAEATASEVVTIIGNVLVLYREKKEEC
ncbi:MAG TPA: ribosome assembly RNA-binding protein YhbY [Spirochaetota bacterium]|nr:ribosome assembly RNA-binding protein YhbY [Spirochaetota bacterium]HQO02252.1 ribosome assembly RNA-binding protein YhbY [Spirochaetota bacterium]HQP49036.1 ribosome assembly RNA-binding protein YhbY [Spirochaetota bacterium]